MWRPSPWACDFWFLPPDCAPSHALGPPAPGTGSSPPSCFTSTWKLILFRLQAHWRPAMLQPPSLNLISSRTPLLLFLSLLIKLLERVVLTCPPHCHLQQMSVMFPSAFTGHKEPIKTMGLFCGSPNKHKQILVNLYVWNTLNANFICS